MKHNNGNNRLANRWKKSTLFIGALLTCMVVTVGGTVAYLVADSDEVVNKFTPSVVTTEVTEDTTNDVKTNVQIKNTGDTDAYIRAAVVVTWQDEKGNVYGQAPAEDDYKITWQGIKDGSWQKGPDGFYYHLSPVADGKSTNVLFTDCEISEDAEVPIGYYLNVEILGSGIQSVPTSVVVDSWSSGVSGVDEDTKKLEIKSSTPQ